MFILLAFLVSVCTKEEGEQRQAPEEWSHSAPRVLGVVGEGKSRKLEDGPPTLIATSALPKSPSSLFLRVQLVADERLRLYK